MNAVTRWGRWRRCAYNNVTGIGSAASAGSTSTRVPAANAWRTPSRGTEPDPIAALRALLAIAGHDPDAHPELDSRARIMAFLRRGDSALGNLPEPVLDGVVRAVTGTNRLIRAHHHAPYRGVLSHVRAGRDHAARPYLQASLWAPHAATVEAIELPFVHAELTGRDAVAQIAPWVSARLQRRDPFHTPMPAQEQPE